MSVGYYRLQDLRFRGISDNELVGIANRLGRAILTRDRDFTLPHLLSQVGSGVIYLSYQPRRSELPRIAGQIASIAMQYKPRPRLLIIIRRDHIEIYD